MSVMWEEWGEAGEPGMRTYAPRRRWETERGSEWFLSCFLSELSRFILHLTYRAAWMVSSTSFKASSSARAVSFSSPSPLKPSASFGVPGSMTGRTAGGVGRSGRPLMTPVLCQFAELSEIW